MAQQDQQQMSFRWAFDSSSWIPTKEHFISCLARIQPEERSRVLSFAFKKDVKPSLVGRLMLRTASAIVTGQANKCISLNRTNKGKPFIDSPTVSGKFDLNVSHHGRYCVLACEASTKVGVDIVNVEFPRGRTLEEYFNLMRKQFSPNEWTFIENSSVDPHTSLSRFMRLWSLKEAYVKAEGFGITTDLKLIDFRPKSDVSSDSVTVDTQLYVNDLLMKGWVFHESMIRGHYVSVAIEKDDTVQIVPRPFVEVDIEFLLNQIEPLIETTFSSELEDAWKLFNSKNESPQSRS